MEAVDGGCVEARRKGHDDRPFVTDLYGYTDPGWVREFAINEPDGVRHTVLNEFQVPFRANGVAFDGTNLVISDLDSGRFLVTNRAGDVLADLATGFRIGDMVFDPSTGSIWALHHFEAKISELSPFGVQLRQCDYPNQLQGRSLWSLAMSGADFYIAEGNPGGFGTIHVVDKGSLVCDPPLVVEVAIDIKPGSEPSSINLGSNGTVPVAILSSAFYEFDATTVDPTSVTLAGAGVRLKGKGTPMSSFQDVNGDLLTDLIVHVETEALDISDGDTIAVVEGETSDGVRIRGEDTVRIVPQ